MSNATDDQPAARVSEVLHGCKVIIGDRSRLQSKLRKFRDDGVDALSVISDFDFTISRFHNKKGERGCSCHKVLEDSGLLSHEYHVQGQAVQKYYYSIEVDPTLTKEERLPFMIEWAHRSHELLVKYGMTKDLLHQAVANAVASEAIRLRDHLVDFLNQLKETDVPMLIFSAGISDVLEGVLAHFTELQDHQPYVISNRCIWEGNELKGFPEPVIHIYNKCAANFLDTPFFVRVSHQKRRNLLLIGDSLGDIGMHNGMEGLVPDLDVLKIGFLNDKVQERMEDYVRAFDVVILEDPGFDVPLGLLEEILGRQSP